MRHTPRVSDYIPGAAQQAERSPNWTGHTEVRQVRVNPMGRVPALHERHLL
jgi:hypothetical protein